MRRVYFIRPVGMQGPIKIGCSYSPDGRKRTLALWSPFPLEIIAEIGGDPLLERRFHARFAASHERHEWFTWTAELQAVIDSVAAGDFDIGTLPPPSLLARKPKDMSYLTPGWHYQRSVAARIQALKRRGLPWQEERQTELWRHCPHDASEAQIEAAKAHCEPIIAEWTRRFPTRSSRKHVPQAEA